LRGRRVGRRSHARHVDPVPAGAASGLVGLVYQQPPGISNRAWLDDAVTGLPNADRAAGRLALLTALASYQVTSSVVDAFRSRHPGDTTLIELTSWASMASARQVGARLVGDLKAPREPDGESIA
jgi:hypothetical protein